MISAKMAVCRSQTPSAALESVENVNIQNPKVHRICSFLERNLRYMSAKRGRNAVRKNQSPSGLSKRN